MPSFLHSDRAIITTMIKSVTKDEIIAEVRRALSEGAEALGFQFETLVEEYFTREHILDIFAEAKGCPIYVTNYMRKCPEEKRTWEQIEEQLLLLADCGATLIDVQGDMYDVSDMELTNNRAAIERQRAFISELHSRGAEVLMSSHVLRFISKESVLALAETQISRGADIAKIVTAAESEDELDENFEALHLLRNKLGAKYLFLCGGEYCKKHRVFGALFGNCMHLTTENARSDRQPKISTARLVLEYDKL